MQLFWSTLLQYTLDYIIISQAGKLRQRQRQYLVLESSATAEIQFKASSRQCSVTYPESCVLFGLWENYSLKQQCLLLQ